MDWQPTQEEFARAIRYAGRDFAKPKMVDVDLLRAWGGGEWTPAEFCEILDTIPPEYASSARIVFETGDGDSFGSLKVLYTRPETADVVAARVARVREYVEDCAAKERSDYERLRAKFG